MKLPTKDKVISESLTFILGLLAGSLLAVAYHLITGTGEISIGFPAPAYDCIAEQLEQVIPVIEKSCHVTATSKSL